MKQNRRLFGILGGVFVVLLGVLALQESNLLARWSPEVTATPLPPTAPPTTTDATTETAVTAEDESIEPEAPEGGVVFDSFPVLEIQAIRIGNPASEQSLTLSRDASGVWTAPAEEGVLDTDAATVIATTVVLLPYYAVVPLEEGADGDEVDLNAFGLAAANPDLLTLEVVLRDGTTHGAVFGGLTPNGAGYFTLADEEPLVFVVERRAVDYLRVQLANPPLSITTD